MSTKNLPTLAIKMSTSRCSWDRDSPSGSVSKLEIGQRSIQLQASLMQGFTLFSESVNFFPESFMGISLQINSTKRASNPCGGKKFHLFSGPPYLGSNHSVVNHRFIGSVGGNTHGLFALNSLGIGYQ